MRIICYKSEQKSDQLAALTDSGQIYVLPYNSFLHLMKEAETKKQGCFSLVQEVIQNSLPIEEKLEDLQLTLPIRPDEVWASGVTYLKSREARNLESKSTTNRSLSSHFLSGAE